MKVVNSLMILLVMIQKQTLRICTIQQGDVEFFIFTIPLDNLGDGSYEFRVPTFEEEDIVELTTINDKRVDSQFFPLLKKQTQNEQSDNKSSLMNSNSSFDIKLGNSKMQPIIPSTTNSTNNKEHSTKSSSNKSEKIMRTARPRSGR